METSLYVTLAPGRWYHSVKVVKVSKRSPKLKEGQRAVRLAPVVPNNFFDPQTVVVPVTDGTVPTAKQI